MAEAGPLGRRLRRLEDGRLLRGEAQFADDLRPEGCLHVAFLRSPFASGRLAALATSTSAAAAGVRAVFTAADLEGSCGPLVVHLTTPGAGSPERPILAHDRVGFAGEMIAAVVAEGPALAAHATERLEHELHPLRAAVPPADARSKRAALCHAA